MGSLLCGSEEFIEKAKRLRKMLGGGMRQIGFMAAAGIYALENNVDRLREDHGHAAAIRAALEETDWAKIERFGTNMVFFSCHGTTNRDVIAHFRKQGILFAEDAGFCRMVTSINVDDEMTDKVVRTIREYRP